MYNARTLAVQSADAALSATGELNVAAYAEAREFEIRSLEEGMQRSKSALTTRAFQKVPRSLRRRTASHNVKRVPSRLRARAKREMIEDNTPTVTARRRKPTQLMRIRLETARRLQGLNAKTKAKRAASKAKRDKETQEVLEETGTHAFEIAPRVPKIKKNKLSRPPPPEAKFQKRQRNKTWLPTHMFHAKRAHMTPSGDPLWRFALPLSPTEKSYRPSHRARGARGAVAWDMSYMSTIQLEGTEPALETVLRAVGVDGEEAWGAKGRRWRAGTRALETWVFEKGNDGPVKPLAPVTLIWRARSKSEDVEMVDIGDSKQKRNRERLFIRIHPSAFLQLWNDLLEVSKRQNPPVMVEDLRFEIGSIEITGPGATEALIATLQPLMGDRKETDTTESTWSSLLGVTNPSSLPQNALLAFSISDPRLHFPPKRLTIPNDDTHMNNLAVLLSSWPPDNTQSAAALFDRPSRLSAVRRLPSQKAISRRRTFAGPGTYPPSQPTDPEIPVILLASRPKAHFPKNGNSSNNVSGTWTVLLPWKCVLPVWYSLMYCPLSSGSVPRFGGLKEQQQLAFEAGEPWFPGDFPGTRAGWEWNVREQQEAKKEWERKPKGRRVEFESLDLGNGQKGEIGTGWACDWERLVQESNGTVRGDKRDAPQMLNTTDNEPGKEGAENDTVPPLNIRQLPPEVTSSLLNRRTPSSIPDYRTALSTVKISLLSRGTPTPRARIYRLPTTNPELQQKWLDLASSQSAQKQKRKQSDGMQTSSMSTLTREEVRQRLAASLISPPVSDKEKEKDSHLPLPSEEDLIGFVTTGNYNLSEGKGTGIGSILLWKALVGGDKEIPSQRWKNMCIIRGSGERVGRLGFWEVI